jgi:hypothetical protein
MTYGFEVCSDCMNSTSGRCPKHWIEFYRQVGQHTSPPNGVITTTHSEYTDYRLGDEKMTMTEITHKISEVDREVMELGKQTSELFGVAKAMNDRLYKAMREQSEDVKEAQPVNPLCPLAEEIRAIRYVQADTITILRVILERLEL